VWAPDNRHVVLDAHVPDVCGNHLYLLDTQGATIHSIAAGLGQEWTPAVSPDGDTLAFATGGNDFDVTQFSLDGSTIRTLLSGSRSEEWPAWATSGEQLAYVTDASGCPELRLTSLKEGWGVPVVARGTSDLPFWIGLQKPSFSPDGRRLAYGVNNQTHSIYVSPVAGGRPIALDRKSIDQHNAAWSPDGNWIAYQRLYEGRWELVKVPLGGGNPIRLDEAQPGGGTDTAWSPKGNWIAHVKAGALWLASADGSARRIIRQSTPVTWGFSHDGSSLYAIDRPAGGEWELVTIDVDTGRQLGTKGLQLPPSAIVRGFALHPDGKSFATSVGTPKFDIWLLHGLNSSR
jgi:Tol biopolymer transport system component